MSYFSCLNDVFRHIVSQLGWEWSVQLCLPWIFIVSSTIMCLWGLYNIKSQQKANSKINNKSKRRKKLFFDTLVVIAMICYHLNLISQHIAFLFLNGVWEYVSIDSCTNVDIYYHITTSICVIFATLSYGGTIIVYYYRILIIFDGSMFTFLTKCNRYMLNGYIIFSIISIICVVYFLSLPNDNEYRIVSNILIMFFFLVYTIYSIFLLYSLSIRFGSFIKLIQRSMNVYSSSVRDEISDEKESDNKYKCNNDQRDVYHLRKKFTILVALAIICTFLLILLMFSLTTIRSSIDVKKDHTEHMILTWMVNVVFLPACDIVNLTCLVLQYPFGDNIYHYLCCIFDKYWKPWAMFETTQ